METTTTLSIYHSIWKYLHSDAFLDIDIVTELDEFEKIIRQQLTFCSCGADAQYIITYLLLFFKIENIDTCEKRRDFWTLFHNLIRVKLNQEVFFFISPNSCLLNFKTLQ